MKKFIALLCVLLMILGLSACGNGTETQTSDGGGKVSSSNTDSAVLPENDPNAVPASELGYVIEDDGTVSIWSYRGSNGDIILPAVIEDCPVTKIHMEAFSFNYTITSVVLPDTIVEIGAEAFEYAINLKSVVLSKNLTTIYNKAFDHCQSLISVNLSETKLESIGSAAFCGTAITEAVLPDTLTDLGSQAFAGCEKLEKLVIPGSVKHITNSIAYDTYALSNLQIGEGVERIDHAAFTDCALLTNVILPDSVKEIGPEIFIDCGDMSITYKGKTYENASGTGQPDEVLSDGLKALYLAVNGKELEE